jgi:outer membrane receptor protein involved in Fe transport
MKPKLLGLMVAAALAIPAHAMAQDATPPQDDTGTTAPTKKVVAKDAQQMQAVTVTGSLIPRAQIEGPSPTTTITADDIQAKGFSNVFEALRALPQANGSVEDAQLTGGYTPGAKTISLLGLSPAYTLTLLNGRPMASYPLAYDGGTNIVDIANIPMGMVDHIDVLTGGQSSIYGSSAIAGVVNIVLKDHVEGTHMALRMGGYTDGGGDSQRFQISSGHKWGDLDVSAGLQFEKDSPIWAYQRSYIDSYYDDPTGKNAVPSRTFLRLDETPGATGYIDPGAATCAPLSYMYGNSTAYSYRSGAGLGHYCGSAKNVSYTTLANKDGSADGTLFLRYHLTPDTELYSDIIYSFSDPTYSGGSPSWNKTFFDQTSGRYEQWQRIYSPEEVGLDAQDQHVFTRSYNAAFGIRGGIGESGFDYDIYYNRSQSNVTRKSTDFYAQNGIDDFYLGPQLGMSEGYPIYAPNLSKLYQPLSLAEYQQVSGINRATSVAWTQNFTATVNNTDLFQLPAGNVGFAAIIQASNERMDNQSAAPMRRPCFAA